MSFSFSGIKSFALKVKESVSSAVDSAKLADSTNSAANSVKSGLSNVLQSVKTGSEVVRKQITQTAESLLSRVNNATKVCVKPSQFRYILDNLERNYDDTCHVKSSIHLGNKLIDKGCIIHSIQGLLVERLPFPYIVDLFLILRNHNVVTVVFTNYYSTSYENSSSISAHECILFLCESYSTLLHSKPSTANKERISDHFITLNALSKWNTFVDFSVLLDQTDVIHVLTVERILIHLIRLSLPQPLLSDSVPLSSLSPSQKSFLKLLFSYCYFVYRYYGSFPSSEYIPLLFSTPSIETASQLILKTSNEYNLFLEWCLANRLALSFHESLVYDSPTQMDSQAMETMAESLQHYISFAEINKAVQNVSDVDCFALILHKLYQNKISEQWCSLLETAMLTSPGIHRLMALRTAIHLLSWNRMCLLYCLLRCAQVTKQAKKVIEAIATFWFPSKYAAKAVSFLSGIMANMDIVFLPMDLRWIDETQDENSLETVELSPVEDESSFALERSFQELHSLAFKPPVDRSIRSMMDRLYSPFHKAAAMNMMNGSPKWFSSMQLFSFTVCCQE